MAQDTAVTSTDILFPEENEPSTSYLEDTFYSPPSSYSAYSTYSHELKFMFGSRSSTPEEPDNQDYTDVTTITERKKKRSAKNQNRFVTEDYFKPPLNDTKPDSYPNFHQSFHIDYYTKGTSQKSNQRTWSPQPHNMGVGSSFQAPVPKRNYRSNEQLDNLDDHHGHIYEDLPDHPPHPPKITPYSGFLSQVPGKVVIRPIAFKPVVPAQQRYVSPSQTASRDSKIPSQTSQDDGYGSQDYQSTNPSQNSFGMEMDRSIGGGSTDYPKLPERPSSFASSNVSHLSSTHRGSYPQQTPSPSDSGVGELEVMLREKDTEISHLRETMEHNERVIFQVYEEKQLSWHMEMKDMREEYQRRQKVQQQRMFKMEQSLMLQVYKLQQEKKAMIEENENLLRDKKAAEKRLEICEEDLKSFKTQQDEAKWEICQKSGEISLLKQQLKEIKEESGSKTNETLTLKAQLKEQHHELMDKNKLIEKLKDDLSEVQMELQGVKADLEVMKRERRKDIKETSIQTEQRENNKVNDREKQSCQEMEHLRLELQKSKKLLDESREQMENEKHQWFAEKDKVVRYQKQLQLNYVQMYRKNRMLESEIEQLTLELENRDMKMIGANDESVC
ncbi:leucine zipper putative tumor suppressor 2 homolog [Lingula anatina]|uniref:Leucine zipper putative tumor suppressor 2 homolog n=1 Tax=Lingula anatina TaxID=7574 RepID=A0A1S3HAT1_LINAN|nr:leucine zipper putative tumor suppressor 2 homolog [Lingula anatina]XP_013383123.1 leucine zipper putative tumor suppressor 2 homolog [Lingula anatina]XP_013383124.1 leucine zipper putative tumor suppressor 2 homolog [Lingula anatina]XP_013383125.1 leucine zipper putative tumor suppressor 2 homolog [Lingula anatina]XP_013383127.1 leucine zipper putative tumor suppressor 2 homolog [Lingula anatina]XP_013383128.1 leucine zipper putative tumor suppressor 2 homolog [Lingula anatina]XP_01338312|eukprot:XP_013383122.1 leucine zipper putative tumor suppressor 2 homolog [Lingula anatina]